MTRYYPPRFPQTSAAAHRKFSRHNGVARLQICVDCQGQAQHWSYNHGGTNEHVCPDTGALYCLLPDNTALDPEFYSPRCSSCHAQYDGHGDTIKNRRMKRHSDPVFMAKVQTDAAVMLKGQTLRSCGECDLVTRPGPLKIHQKHTNHKEF